jgi:hypothetical protein
VYWRVAGLTAVIPRRFACTKRGIGSSDELMPLNPFCLIVHGVSSSIERSNSHTRVRVSTSTTMSDIRAVVG